MLQVQPLMTRTMSIQNRNVAALYPGMDKETDWAAVYSRTGKGEKQTKLNSKLDISASKYKHGELMHRGRGRNAYH